jgi:hypothetical protein
MGQDQWVSSHEAVNAVAAAPRARADALVAGDHRRLAALPHPQLRWTTHTGTVLDRDGYLASNLGGELRWLGQSLDEVDVQVVGDAVAILTAMVTDVVTRDGRPEAFRLRLTQVWVDSAEGWRCLAGHAGPRLT